jgi:hypothetical protein
MWKKYCTVRQATDDTIWRMRSAWRMTKAADTHSEYVIFTAFPLQQWLHKRASMLRYTCIGCIVHNLILSLGHETFSFVFAERTDHSGAASDVTCGGVHSRVTDRYHNMATFTYESLPIFRLRITDVPSRAVSRRVAQISSNMTDNGLQTFSAKPFGTTGEEKERGAVALATSKSSLERTKFRS